MKCAGCRKFKLFCKYRTYKAVPPLPSIKSKDKICRTCYKAVKKLLNGQK